MAQYTLPKVWKNTQSQGLNSDTAGSRFEQTLPKGDKPYQLYTLSTPNGIKPIILLEELLALGMTDAQYNMYKINIMKGEQFGSDFVALNPNSKIPALLDQAQGGLRIFESAHILWHIAKKHQAFLGETPQEQSEVLNWLFWQTGAAPFLGGGFGHFFKYAPEKLEYPINRYTMETKRQLDLLDQLLAKRTYIAGEHYTIADIAIWSWYGRLLDDKVYPGAAQFLDGQSYHHLHRWNELIKQRPAVQKALEKSYDD
ncbi:glutathione-dependent disulfide-bond oxidoreductase [Streptococcus halichoeri]|uniref:glutathione-dependent disulfide-bond oxidoreductase n=1 Tax=Streptococcus halichoeri TaxID=254785 RepID=UPI000DAF70BA|nr:glutathione-dependent disulfide-bond oxidoreductase [Streptococcus halichoeri]PZO94145.1 MAG: glutathione-dependent disulfide-bond oxidoreductase [Streptococcus pyogenes]